VKEAQPNWVTVLEFEIHSADEREVLESFVLTGRSADVPIPKPGEPLRFVDESDLDDVKVTRVTRTAHEIIRRGNPWTVRTRYQVAARVAPKRLQF